MGKNGDGEGGDKVEGVTGKNANKEMLYSSRRGPEASDSFFFLHSSTLMHVCYIYNDASVKSLP